MSTTRRTSRGTNKHGKRFWWGVIVLGFILLAIAAYAIYALVNAGSTVSRSLTAGKGGRVIGAGIVLEIPPNALPKDSRIAIRSVKPEASPYRSALQKVATAMGKTYNITAVAKDLDDRIYLTLSYDPRLLPAGVDEERVSIGYYDEQLRRWVALASYVDVKSHTVSAYTDHLSWFSSVFWSAKNQPPVITDFYFDPSAVATDCDALKKDPGPWLKAHPFTIHLSISDPDGLNDILGDPEITLRPDHYFHIDKDYGPFSMRKIGPGQYAYDVQVDLGSDWWIEPFTEAFSKSCGNLITYKARVRVRDRAGNAAESSAVMDVRYEELPDISLDSPRSNDTVPVRPTLHWSISGPKTVLKKYENLTLTVATDAGLSKEVIQVNLPLDQQEYKLPAGTLTLGKRYYWTITLNKFYYGTGAAWSELRTQVQSFIVADVCVPDKSRGCIAVTIKKPAGGTIGGATVTLHVSDDPVNRLSKKATNDSGVVSFLAVPGETYYVWSTASGYKAWNGEYCTVSVAAGKQLKLEISLTEGQGTVSCESHPMKTKVQAAFTATRTPGPKATATRKITPTRTPKPTKKITSTSGKPMLKLDKNYFCNHGPGANYEDVVDYPAGTVLPIIGSNGGGWWLVEIHDPRTSHTSCWIGGGVPSGNLSKVPVINVASLPIRDFNHVSNGHFTVIGYMPCDQVASYTWTIEDFETESGGYYVSKIPLFGRSFAGWTRADGIAICGFNLP
jgi:hypothetical protein